MSRLETQRISRASADQRQGRAGRTEPGVSYRAWSEGAHRSLAPFTPPEIAEADLIPLALELASWGTRDPNALRWLDPPPAAMLASARDVLEKLGALDSDGRITPHGREMASIGVHPRFAHMLLRARGMGRLPLAADLAALLGERDLLRGASGARDADIRTRIEVMRGEGSPPGIDRFGLQRARRAAKDLQRQADGVQLDRAGSAVLRLRCRGRRCGVGIRLSRQNRTAQSRQRTDALRLPMAVGLTLRSRRGWPSRSSSWRLTSMIASAMREFFWPRL